MVGTRGQNLDLLRQGHGVKIEYQDVSDGSVELRITGIEANVKRAEDEVNLSIEFQKVFGLQLCHPERPNEEEIFESR